MKTKRLWLLLAGIVALLALAACSGKAGADQPPYKNLKASDIQTASVYIFPPGDYVEIEDKDKLISCLNQLVLTENNEDLMIGQSSVLNITKTDESQIILKISGEFIEVDGVMYKAENGSANALISFIDSLKTVSIN